MTEKEEIKKLNEKIDRLQKSIDELSKTLYRHIKFIDSTYEGLRNPINAAKKWLGRCKKFLLWVKNIPLLHAPGYFLAIVGVFLLILTFVL